MFSIIPYRTHNNMAPRNFFNDFEDSFFRPFFQDGMLRPQNPMKVDIREEEDRFVLQADIPGVKKENLKVEAQDDTLTISADYNADTEVKEDGKGYVYRERRTGSFRRAFNIEGIKEEDITARFEDGVLTLNLPKQPAEARPEARAIEIQ